MKGFVQIGKKEKKGTGWIVLHFALSLLLFSAFWLWFRFGSISSAGQMDFRLDVIVLLGYTAGIYFFSRIYNAYLQGYVKIKVEGYSPERLLNLCNVHKILLWAA